MIDLLLQHGADPQAADAEQRTALFYAARANRAGQRQGAAARRRAARCDATARGYNALDAALVVGAEAGRRASCARLGLHANRVTVDPARQSGKFDPAHPGDIYRGWPPLALAVARNDTPSVQQLLAAGGDANLRLPQGDPLLQVAADAHAVQSLQLLLARGADAAAADHSGHTALWLAATRNDRRRGQGAARRRRAAGRACRRRADAAARGAAREHIRRSRRCCLPPARVPKPPTRRAARR